MLRMTKEQQVEQLKQLAKGMGQYARESDPYLYVIKAHTEEYPHRYKIGYTSDLNRRLRTIKTQQVVSVELFVAFKVLDAKGLEKKLHEIFRDNRRDQGEWFDLDKEDLKTITSMPLIPIHEA